MESADEALRAVRELAVAAQAQEEAARTRLAQARRLRLFWQELQALLDTGQPSGALLVLRREAEAIRQGNDAIPAELLDTVVAYVEQQARVEAASFQRTFPAALQGAGVTLDNTSRHPRYTVRDGFLHVEVDDQSLTAKVRPRDGVEIMVGLDVAALVDMVRAEVQRLFARPLSPDEFLRRLWGAYQALLREEERTTGDAVPLRRLLARLGHDTHPVPADEFNVDLARLVQSEHTAVEGHRLQLHPTRRTRQGMLLHGLETGGYAGFISFGQEEAGC